MNTEPESFPQPLDSGIASLFTQLADLVYAGQSFDETFTALCVAAPAMITGCDHASLMVREHDRFITVAANDEVARAVDALERQVGDGPCVDALTDEAWQLDPDIARASQWPTLAERVIAETPVRGMAGFRLRGGDVKVAALNFFSDTPNALDDQAATEAAVVTAFASVVLASIRAHEQAASLRDGLESNREIGKAIGLLMAGHKIGSEEAFAKLKKASNDLNLKLSHVAREVVDYHNQR